MTSLNFYCLPKGPSPKYSHIGWGLSCQHMNLGEEYSSVHSITKLSQSFIFSKGVYSKETIKYLLSRMKQHLGKARFLTFLTTITTERTPNAGLQIFHII